jgi:hypothetical protein
MRGVSTPEDPIKQSPVWMHQSIWMRLRQEALDTGTSASAIVRDLIVAHLEKQDQPQREKNGRGGTR